jgi:hypothetical protein
MGFFRTAISTLSMAMTGEVIQQIDTPIMDGHCQISLRLKRKKDDSDAYVVLAGIASGNYQYYPMKAEDFVQFADAVQVIKSQLLSANQK